MAPQARDIDDDNSSKENSPLNVIIEGASIEDRSTKIRERWASRLDFIMTALSFAVGMGNIWRFPYMCYKNGGGAFLIAYVIMVLLAGIPMLYLEFSFGQYGSQGIVSIWKAVPLFQGIGWGMFSVSFLTSIYYNILIAYSFFYMFASFAKDVPWRNCDNNWNTKACGSVLEERNCTLHNGTWYNNTCYHTLLAVNNQHVHSVIGNMSEQEFSLENDVKHKSASDEYFHRFMLDMSDGLHSLGAPRWQLVLLLLFCWTLVAVCLSRGIKSFGKVTYVTALFPYIILTILLIRMLLLDGAVDGIVYYVTPNFKNLLTAQVWVDAAVQVFFSLSVCWGGLITLASYNNFNNNCLRDAFVVGVGDALTSIFGGFVTFAIIGYMTNELKVPIEEVVTQGAGLAFIIYPTAITNLPVAPLWAILFMLMLINLGIGTQLTVVATIHTTLLDVLSDKLRKGYRPLISLLTICAICFFCGLIMTTQGGMYILQLMDIYTASYALLILAVFELVALGWVYGYKRFADNIQEMTGSRPGLFWMICWKFITPAVIMGIFVFSLVNFTPSEYGDFRFPWWSDVVGWLIVCAEVICVPAVAIYKLCTADKQLSILETFARLGSGITEWISLENASAVTDNLRYQSQPQVS